MNAPRNIASLLAALLLSSPVAAAMLEFDEYVHRGNAARTRGDWESVANQFAQAINHPDLPKEGATKSAMHLEYGRALGVICQYGEAEKYLLLAKGMAEKSGSPTLSALYELGSISVAQKKFAEANEYFSPFFLIIERDPRVKLAPQVIIDAYEKASAALAATGKSGEAETRRREADKFRETRAKPPPPGTITPYGAQCPKA